MATSVLCVPQWQGSGRADARRLADGARATAGLLPGVFRVEVPVLQEPGIRRSGVAHLDVLASNLGQIRAAIASLPDGLIVTAGGDCGVELAPVADAVNRHGDALTLLWLDAHADANTPQSSPSGAFHGMVLRTLLGDGPRELCPTPALRPAQVLLAGVRALDPAEREYVQAAGLRHLGVAEIERIAELRGPLYVHLDLDVLEPGSFGAISCPEPGGVAPQRLAEALSRLSHVIGIGVTEHAPYASTAIADAAVLGALLHAVVGSGAATAAS